MLSPLTFFTTHYFGTSSSIHDFCNNNPVEPSHSCAEVDMFDAGKTTGVFVLVCQSLVLDLQELLRIPHWIRHP